MFCVNWFSEHSWPYFQLGYELSLKLGGNYCQKDGVMKWCILVQRVIKSEKGRKQNLHVCPKNYLHICGTTSFLNKISKQSHNCAYVHQKLLFRFYLELHNQMFFLIGNWFNISNSGATQHYAL